MGRKRYYQDDDGENGVIIRDLIKDNKCVYEYGVSGSDDLCDLLNEKEDKYRKCKMRVKFLQGKLNAYEDIMYMFNINSITQLEMILENAGMEKR